MKRTLTLTRCIVALILPVAASLVVSSCHKPERPVTEPSVTTAPVAASRGNVPHVQTTAAYRAVVESYQAKDYAGASHRIEGLLQTSTLSPADRAFLERQKVLCADGSGNTPKSRVAAAKPFPALVSPARHTATTASSDCGPRALLLVCQHLNAPATLAMLTQAAHTTKQGTTLAGLEKAAKAVGLQANGVQVDRDALKQLNKPAVAWLDGNHYVALLSVDGDTATIHDPNDKSEKQVDVSDLLSRSGGILLTLAASVPGAKTEGG